MRTSILLPISLLISALSTVISHAYLSEEDLMALHSRFMSPKQLEDFQRKLRGGLEADSNTQESSADDKETWWDRSTGLYSGLRGWRGGKGRTSAGGDGGGRGGGGGGHRQGHGGGMTEEVQETIQALALAGKQGTIKREVVYTNIGVNSTTWSNDEDVTALLRLHVRQMKNLATPVRQCDPLFEVFFHNIGKMDLHYKNIPKGVFVEHIGSDQCGVDLIHDHAEQIKSFSKGDMKVRSYQKPHSCLQLP